MKVRKVKTKFILRVIVILIVAGLAFGGYKLYRQGRVGTGFVAKGLCSALFLSGRDPDQVRQLDLIKGKLISATIDRKKKTVTCSLGGMLERRAIYRQNLGCTLVIGRPEADIRRQKTGKLDPADTAGKPWPTGDVMASGPMPTGIDAAKLKQALKTAFAEPDPKALRRTWAVLVVYRGRIVAERYAPGFNKNTRFMGWSMTKSVINALVGILVGQKKLFVDKPAPVPEWQTLDDPRKHIKLDHLLRMVSGLKFVEDYADVGSDVVVMLYAMGDKAAFAASKKLVAKPGALWSYSSGTTNIVSRIIRRAVGGKLEDYLSFPRRAIFDRLGMRSAVIEPDASGTFTGSSFMYATPRDWARFGLLYLQDGVWEGKRILPEGWVAYSTRPTKGAPLGMYGAHFWLNAGEAKDKSRRWMPRVPVDMFTLRGYQHQYVSIIPSYKLVVVRLGLTLVKKDWDQGAFLADVVAAFKKP